MKDPIVEIVKVGDLVTTPHYSISVNGENSSDALLDKQMAKVVFVVMGVEPVPVTHNGKELVGFASLSLMPFEDQEGDPMPYMIDNTQVKKVTL